MTARILLVRHGRSEANEAGLWQGHGDADLSPTGRDQAVALGERLADVGRLRVVASDLRRARHTAEAVGGADVVDPAWKEMDLGAWEGETFEKVLDHDPEMLAAIRRGDDIRFGGDGETVRGFEARVNEAFDRLASDLSDGETAIVVTHGGAIDAIVARFLGRVEGRRAYPIPTNTSLTEITRSPQGWSLGRFNDAIHLDEEAGFLGQAHGQGYGVLGLLRHGLTTANIDGRVQGQSCWGLAEAGYRQAAAFAARYRRPDVLYSSPQERAVETARAFRQPVVQDDRLKEIASGRWEGMLVAALADDPLVRRVWVDGEDLARGHTGETFHDVKVRVGSFLSDVDVRPGRRALAVSHGVTIRAAVATIVDRGFEFERVLNAPSNSGATHIAIAGPEVRQPGNMLIDYNTTVEV